MEEKGKAAKLAVDLAELYEVNGCVPRVSALLYSASLATGQRGAVNTFWRAVRRRGHHWDAVRRQGRWGARDPRAALGVLPKQISNTV